MFWIVEVIMREPPAAPMETYSFPSEVSIIVGDMEDSGRLPGRMKFAGLGA